MPFFFMRVILAVFGGVLVCDQSFSAASGEKRFAESFVPSALAGVRILGNIFYIKKRNTEILQYTTNMAVRRAIAV